MNQAMWVSSAAALAMAFSIVAGPVAAGSATKEGKDMETSQATQTPDIVATAVAAGSFKTLAGALQAAGLVETLKGKGPFTVFAPTDDAFAKLPKGTVETLLKPENKEKLASVLTYHVVPGSVLAKDVVGLKSAKTVNGQSLTVVVKEGKVSIDGANVIKTDILCSNGVIHVIDSVVLPK
jgi:uncharacterized surface protein with fasciclin (FAS1) repeats